MSQLFSQQYVLSLQDWDATRGQVHLTAHEDALWVMPSEMGEEYGVFHHLCGLGGRLNLVSACDTVLHVKYFNNLPACS